MIVIGYCNSVSYTHDFMARRRDILGLVLRNSSIKNQEILPTMMTTKTVQTKACEPVKPFHNNIFTVARPVF